MKNKYMSFPYGDYEGEYLEYGKPHGKGTFNYFDGGIYKGEWKNGMMDGYGEFIEYYEPEYFINRDGTAKPVNKYKGNFIKGKKEGKFEVYEHMGEHDEKPSDWTKQKFKNDY